MNQEWGRKGLVHTEGAHTEGADAEGAHIDLIKKEKNLGKDRRYINNYYTYKL